MRVRSLEKIAAWCLVATACLIVGWQVFDALRVSIQVTPGDGVDGLVWSIKRQASGLRWSSSREPIVLTEGRYDLLFKCHMSTGRDCTLQGVIDIVSDIVTGGGFSLRSVDCPQEYVFSLIYSDRPTVKKITVSGIRTEEGFLSLGLSTSSRNVPSGDVLCRSGKEVVEIKSKAYDIHLSGSIDLAVMVLEGNLSSSRLSGPLPVTVDLDAGTKLDGVPLLNDEAPSWISQGVHHFSLPEGASPGKLTLNLPVAGGRATIAIQSGSQAELPRSWLVRIR